MPIDETPKTKSFNPFGDLLGLTFSKMDDGYSECWLEVNEDHLNPYGMLHGGVIYTLADTGMGGAMVSRLDEGQRCATVEVKINYLRFATSGKITCKTNVIHKSRTLGFMQSEVYKGKRLIATATGTFSIFQARKQSE